MIKFLSLMKTKNDHSKKEIKSKEETSKKN